MKNKLPLPRKKVAMRWAAVLCVLVILCGLTDAYGFTRSSVLRRQERFYFVQEAQLIECLPDAYEKRIGKGEILAAKNDHVLFLGMARWTPWKGWQPGFAWPVERVGNLVDSMYAYYSWDSEGNVYPYVVFGVVNDPRVDAVKVSFEDWQTKDVRMLDVQLFTDGSGQRYFLCAAEMTDICRVGITAWGGEVLLQDTSLEESGISLSYDWDRDM